MKLHAFSDHISLALTGFSKLSLPTNWLATLFLLFTPPVILADALVLKAGSQDFRSGSERWPLVGVEYLKPFSAVSLSISALNAFDFVYGGSESQYNIGVLTSGDSHGESAPYFGAGASWIQTSADGDSNGFYLQLGYRWGSSNKAQHGIELRMVEGNDIHHAGSTTQVGSTQLAYTYLFNPFSK